MLVIVIFPIFSQLMQREDQLKEKSSSSDCDKTRTITKNCREQQDTGGTGSVLSKFYISPVGLLLDPLDLHPALLLLSVGVYPKLQDRNFTNSIKKLVNIYKVGGGTLLMQTVSC